MPGPATKAASVQDSGQHYHSRVVYSAADGGHGIMILVGRGYGVFLPPDMFHRKWPVSFLAVSQINIGYI